MQIPLLYIILNNDRVIIIIKIIIIIIIVIIIKRSIQAGPTVAQLEVFFSSDYL